MTCPTCGSPHPEERWCKWPLATATNPAGYHRGNPFCCMECEDSYHNQILDPEKREQVLSSQY